MFNKKNFLDLIENLQLIKEERKILEELFNFFVCNIFGIYPNKE